MAQVVGGLLTADGFTSVPAEVWLSTLAGTALATLVKLLTAAQKVDTVSPASFAPAFPDFPADEAPDDSRPGSGSIRITIGGSKNVTSSRESVNEL